MFIEVQPGRLINLDHVTEVKVEDEEKKLTLIMKDGSKISESYSDEYAIKNILESMRVEIGVYLKSDNTYEVSNRGEVI